MFFLVSKTVAFLLLPSNILIVLGLFGVVLMAARRTRAGTCLLLTSIVLLAIAGWWPAGNLLTHTLESRFPPWNATRAPDGIVVLGGAIKSRLSHEFGQAVLGDEADRILAMAKLARAYPARAYRLFRGRRELARQSTSRSEFRNAVARGAGHSARPRDVGVALAQHRRKCHFHQRTCKTKAGRAMASCDLGATYAARDWLLSAGRISGRSLSGRLAHRSSRGSGGTDAIWRCLGALRFGSPRMDRSACIYWITGRTSEFLPSP